MVALHTPEPEPQTIRHQRWVKGAHWIITMSFLVLSFSGFVILMSHPRLYWGEVGNDLTPALFELPISRNHQHGGWDNSTPFFQHEASPRSASRSYDIFNQNDWGRSLHFLAAWWLVLTGVVYLLAASVTGHFRRHLLPRASEFTPRLLWRDFVSHFGRSRLPARLGSHYGLLQKCTYSVVIFFLLPLIVLTGLAMSPAITAAYPFLLTLFQGVQSARTIHFFAFVALLLFLFIHVGMVIRSGFKEQIRAMTFGN
jgi:thiosulfate reductase cytochrome b subunit